jgi:thiol:disulfide interchange protein DsbD
MQKIFLAILLSFFISFSYAAKAVNPLPADEAFAFSAYFDQNKQLILEWNIAPGYYLYRNQLSFTPSPTSRVQIGKLALPQGKFKKDVLHGVFQAYVGSIKVPIPLMGQTNGLFDLHVNYQGCSSEGFCYTPIQKSLTVNPATHYVQTVGAMKKPVVTSDDAITRYFNGKNLFIIVLGFLGLGLLLAFTPCVLPMVPILSGIIVGHGKRSTKSKAFLLSLSYVSGMAVTYAIVGIVIALIGSSIQAQLQKTWVIILFSGLFVLLALSLFGLYELQMPSRLRQLVSKTSDKQKSGSYIGVFLMGSLSTLIVSPCVSAPLVGVLAYIGQSGDVILGAIALLALGIGMGIPLLIIGLSADRILPKAGPWMATIERLFGVMMLGVAIWMASRMVPGPVTLFLWAILCIFAAIFIGVFSPVPRFLNWLVKGAAVVALIYGVILLVGAVMGNTDPLNPWEQFSHTENQHSKKTPFTVLQSMEEVNKQLTIAKESHKPAILDFYADWCVSCVLMDRTIFSKSNVQKALTKFVLLRIDLTQNNSFDQAILKRFNVVGPPTLIFFSAKGQELTSARIVGEVTANEFLNKVKEVN